VNKLVASLLALAVVVVVGCGSTAPYAATVNDARLTQSDLEDELDAITRNDDYVKLLEQGQPPVAVRGKGKGTFDQTFVARVLTREIFYRLVRDELAKRKLTVEEPALAEARRNVVQQVGGDEVLAKFPAGYRNSLVRRTAELDTLTRALAKDKPAETQDPRAFYAENKATFDTYSCISHILVADKAKADDLAARIGRGEDFAALARTESTDNQGEGGGSAAKGGDLGCADPASFVPEFATAVNAQAVGQVGAPVQTQYGFHIIKVTARPPTYEQVEPQVQQRLQQQVQEQNQGALNTWLQEAVRKAKITVNPRYGRFSKKPDDFGVVPPKAPARSTTTTTATSPQP
jgi:parvulin-like peptidyl-prolyl isomerase